MYRDPSTGKETTAVFKYLTNPDWIHSFFKELHIYMHLPPHPNRLPIDRVVLDEVRGDRVVGFTTPFVPNGDLKNNKSRPFKLKYLMQLMQVIDDLNLRCGIPHQDVAPQNLFIDPTTDNLLCSTTTSHISLAPRAALTGIWARSSPSTTTSKASCSPPLSSSLDTTRLGCGSAILRQRTRPILCLSRNGSSIQTFSWTTTSRSTTRS